MLGLSCLLALGARSVRAQAVPTARQKLQLSGFAGAAGVYTGLGGGRNLSINAGLDVGFRPYFGLSPAIEVRGMYPVDVGSVDSQTNVLAGLVVGRRYRGLHPYADFLFGRGRIDYSPPYPDLTRSILYLRTASNVFSPGAGVDLGVTRRFGVKADVQYQRYGTPVTASGHLYAAPITLGLIYHLDLNRTADLPNR